MSPRQHGQVRSASVASWTLRSRGRLAVHRRRRRRGRFFGLGRCRLGKLFPGLRLDLARGLLEEPVLNGVELLGARAEDAVACGLQGGAQEAVLALECDVAALELLVALERRGVLEHELGMRATKLFELVGGDAHGRRSSYRSPR